MGGSAGVCFSFLTISSFLIGSLIIDNNFIAESVRQGILPKYNLNILILHANVYYCLIDDYHSFNISFGVSISSTTCTCDSFQMCRLFLRWEWPELRKVNGKMSYVKTSLKLRSSYTLSVFYGWRNLSKKLIWLKKVETMIQMETRLPKKKNRLIRSSFILRALILLKSKSGDIFLLPTMSLALYSALQISHFGTSSMSESSICLLIHSTTHYSCTYSMEPEHWQMVIRGLNVR